MIATAALLGSACASGSAPATGTPTNPPAPEIAKRAADVPADVVRAGELRAHVLTVFTGPAREPFVDLRRAVARDLATSMDVRLGSKEFPRGTDFHIALAQGSWHVAFADSANMPESAVERSAPLTESDLTFLVPPGSALRTSADVDQAGIRVSAWKGRPPEVFFSRQAKHAHVVGASTLQGAFELLRDGKVDALAVGRPEALYYADRLAGARVLDDRFGVGTEHIIVPAGRADLLAYVDAFIRQLKSSGALQRLITQTGLRGVQVAQ